MTVTVPLARFNVAAAADEAFNRKVQGTAQACQDQGIAFFPVAVETLGGFHRVATEQVKRIGCLLYTSPSPRDVEESRMPSSA